MTGFVFAAITALVCLVMSYPLAMLIARSPQKHRDLLVLLVILPFWSNFLIRVYAWIIILGPQSVFVGALNAMLGWIDWHEDGRIEAGIVPVDVEPPGRPVQAQGARADEIARYVERITLAAGLPAIHIGADFRAELSA